MGGRGVIVHLYGLPESPLCSGQVSLQVSSREQTYLLTFAVVYILFSVYYNESPTLVVMRCGATLKGSWNNVN